VHFFLHIHTPRIVVDSLVIPRPRSQVFFDALFDSSIMRWNDLSPICPINLVSIVFFWVMTSCHHDTTCSTLFTDSKRNHGSVNQSRIPPNFESCVQKSSGGQSCKVFRVLSVTISMIVSNNHTHILCLVSKHLQHVLCKTLRSLNDCQVVHSRVSGTHGSSQPRRSKLHSMQEKGGKGLFVPCRHQLFNLRPRVCILSNVNNR
jgi:hypothetical protein